MVISACLWCVFPWNLEQISLSNPELLIFFQKIKDGGRRHLGIAWVSHGTTHEASFVVHTSCKKFCHDRLSSFQVIRIWIYSRLGLKVLLRPQNFSFWGILSPKFRDTSLRPQKALPWAERRVLSPHWSRSDAQCDLWPWQRTPKKGKKDSGKLAIRPDHPRRRVEVKVCKPGGLRCVVLYFKFY